MESRPPTPSPRQALSRFCRAVRPERCFLFGLGLNQEWVAGKDLFAYQSAVPARRYAPAGYSRPYQRVPFPSRIGFPAYGRRPRGAKANTLWIDGSIRCSGAGVHPGSESGTCFRTNRSCRLVPAHQGMKSRSCGLVPRIGTVDSATPHPDPSGGHAPALHFLIPPSTIGLQFGTFRRWRAGTRG